MTRGAATLALLLAAAAPARAACPDIPTIARFASAVLAREVPAPLPVTTLAEARCAQDREAQRAAGYVIGWHEAQAELAWTVAPKGWSRLRKRGRFWA